MKQHEQFDLSAISQSRLVALFSRPVHISIEFKVPGHKYALVNVHIHIYILTCHFQVAAPLEKGLETPGPSSHVKLHSHTTFDGFIEVINIIEFYYYTFAKS